MNITGKHLLIYSGKICPYCLHATLLIDSIEFYGVSFGLVWACRKCKAWVGVHKGTERALGRLANASLREWKKKAHDAFDNLWKNKIFKSRTKAYKWLSDELDIPFQYTHIGMFSEDICKKVIILSKNYDLA